MDVSIQVVKGSLTSTTIGKGGGNKSWTSKIGFKILSYFSGESVGRYFVKFCGNI